MAILTVGPNEEYSTLEAAVAAAQNGDVVQVQAGTYVDNFATVTTKITIQGVGGEVYLTSNANPIPNDGGPDAGRAIILAETSLTLDHISVSGAVDGTQSNNGAGVLFGGGNLDVNAGYFFNDQDGLLAGPDFSSVGTITVLNSEFSGNGTGNGFTHNLYVGVIGSLVVRDSYFTDAIGGHEIKSNAGSTIITNNVLADGTLASATTSYSVDVAAGGTVVVSGNVIEKGPNAVNEAFIHLGGGTPSTSLLVSNNTIIDDATSFLPNLVLNQSAPTVVPTVTGNSIYSAGLFSYSNQPVTLSNNTTLTTEPAYSTAQPFVSPPEIDFVGTASHYVTTTPGGQISLFSGFSFTVPYDGAVSVTLSGWNSALGSVSYNGADSAISVQAPASGTLTLSGRASAIAADFAAGDFVYSATAASGTSTVYVSVADPAVFLDLGTGGAGALETTFSLAAGDVIAAPCFAAGTRILTRRGERAVETLRPGERVITASGRSRRVVWVGYRHEQCSGHAHPQAVWPVRVRAEAFGPDSPHTDLLLSPQHAVFVDGVLIPIKRLINGTTVVQEPCAAVTYYHVELTHHDVLLAQGLPAESWLDTGNRDQFENCPQPLPAPLEPDIAASIWATKACAPLVQAGDVLTRVRARLAAQAAHLTGGAAIDLEAQDCPVEQDKPDHAPAGLSHCSASCERMLTCWRWPNRA